MIALKFLAGGVAWKMLDSDKADMQLRSFRVIPDNCVSEAVFSQLFFFATTCWNFAWVINFVLDLANPLRSTRSLSRYYHGVIWPLSIATAVWAGLPGNHGSVPPVHVCACVKRRSLIDLMLACPRSIGDDFTCNLRQDHDATEVVFAIPLCTVLLAALMSLVYAGLRLPVGNTVRAARAVTG
jgi:hypothetical protein